MEVGDSCSRAKRRLCCVVAHTSPALTSPNCTGFFTRSCGASVGVSDARRTLMALPPVLIRALIAAISASFTADVLFFADSNGTCFAAGSGRITEVGDLGDSFTSFLRPHRDVGKVGITSLYVLSAGLLPSLSPRPLTVSCPP